MPPSVMLPCFPPSLLILQPPAPSPYSPSPALPSTAAPLSYWVQHQMLQCMILTELCDTKCLAGWEEGIPTPNQTLRCMVQPAKTAALVKLVEDFLTVPGSEVKFATRTLDTGAVEFLINKRDMKAWLQSVDVLSTEHAPINDPAEREMTQTATSQGKT